MRVAYFINQYPKVSHGRFNGDRNTGLQFIRWFVKPKVFLEY